MTTPAARTEPAATAGPAASTTAVLLVCSATLVLGTVLHTSLLPWLPRLAAEQHFSATTLALVAGAASVGVFVAALPAGALVARYGARSVLAAASIALALAALVLVVDDRPFALVTSRLVQGIAGSMAWGAAFPWIADVAPAHRWARLLGILLGAGTVGGLVGPLVPVAADLVGIRLVFGGIALLSLLVCAATLVQPRPTPQPTPSGSSAATRTAYRTVLAGGWLVVLAGVVIGGAQVLGSLRLDRLGAPATQIALVLVLATACQTMVGPIAGAVTDRYGALLPVTAGLVVTALVLTTFTAAGSTPVQALVVLGCIVATTVMWGPAFALMSDAARRAGFSQGGVFAVANLAWAAGTFAGTAGGGAVTRLGIEAGATHVIAVVLLLTAGAVWVGRARRVPD